VDHAGDVDAVDRADEAELQHRSHGRIIRLAVQGFLQGQFLIRAASVLELQRVDEPQFLADAETREVDDDIESFRDALLVEFVHGHRIDQEVAVVGDDLDRHPVAPRIGERELDETRHARA